MGHHMPPRTTQQSHSAARPGGRVSDRTMVGTSPPFGLCSFSRERHCSVDVKTISELRISATQHDEKGWMPKNHLFLQQREKCFLLTSPFIEPADSGHLKRFTQHAPLNTPPPPRHFCLFVVNTLRDSTQSILFKADMSKVFRTKHLSGAQGVPHPSLLLARVGICWAADF